MSESVFSVGDVVRLKSGGPKMTVSHVGNDAHGRPGVWCTWAVEPDGGFKEHLFRVAMLEQA
jgi:uncharacterized protein YodC (DUF2158 family)